MIRLLHITDVGSASGNGTDSSVRILKQYRNLGFDAEIISAGNSPIHIAFTGVTTLSEESFFRSQKTLEKLNLSHKNKEIIALNCAPRNDFQKLAEGKEKCIFRVESKNEIFLMYGEETLSWVLYFLGNEVISLSKILSVKNIIPDTSKGSQFRSGEHLPIVHIIEYFGKTFEFCELEKLNYSEIGEKNLEKLEGFILPSDEYFNSRILVTNETFEIFKKLNFIKFENNSLKFAESLTDVIQGELSIWLSSNHFPNKNLKVLNIGTRWEVGKTFITNENVKNLSENLNFRVGEKIIFEI